MSGNAEPKKKKHMINEKYLQALLRRKEGRKEGGLGAHEHGGSVSAQGLCTSCHWGKHLHVFVLET